MCACIFRNCPFLDLFKTNKQKQKKHFFVYIFVPMKMQSTWASAINSMTKQKVPLLGTYCKYTGPNWKTIASQTYQAIFSR